MDDDEPVQENGLAESKTKDQDKDEPMPQVEVIEQGETASGSRDSSVVVSDMLFVRLFVLFVLFVLLQFVLFCFGLFCLFVLFCFVLFYFVVFCFVGWHFFESPKFARLSLIN